MAQSNNPLPIHHRANQSSRSIQGHKIRWLTHGEQSNLIAESCQRGGIHRQQPQRWRRR